MPIRWPVLTRWLFAALLATAPALAAEIHVLVSGAFTAAYQQLVPQFEHATGHTVITEYGASMGGAPDSIPSRLDRGERVDIVILASSGLEDLLHKGQIRSGTRIDLVRSAIGMAVRAGAPKPDISTVEALKQTLLAAKSIAYSDSASGVYLSTELFARLGLADALREKSQRISVGRVGTVVARGDAEIGFQQVSELLPVPGIEYVGPLPEGAQRITIFSAAITTSATEPSAAADLIRFLHTPTANSLAAKTGLEPISDSPSDSH